MVYFRTCLLVGITPSRSVETGVRGCHDYSFSDPQDLLNILTASLLENEQGGEPDILRGEERCSGECLTDGEWKDHPLLGGPFGSMLTARVHVFSDSVFCTRPGVLNRLSSADIWEQKAEAVMKRDKKCKNRIDIAGMARMSWKHIVADTAKNAKIMSESGHAPESVPDRIIFTIMFNDITDCGSRQCLDSAKEVATCAVRIRHGYWHFCGSGLGKHFERPCHQVADGEWDELALRMIGELNTSKHPWSSVPTCFKKVYYLMLMNMVSPCSELCLFAVKMDSAQDAGSSTSYNDLNQE